MNIGIIDAGAVGSAIGHALVGKGIEAVDLQSVDLGRRASSEVVG